MPTFVANIVCYQNGLGYLLCHGIEGLSNYVLAVLKLSQVTPPESSLETFPLYNSWAAFVVFLLAYPHLLEG